jgi:hypothetical protein
MTAGLRNFYIFAPQQLGFNAWLVHPVKAALQVDNIGDYEGTSIEIQKAFDDDQFDGATALKIMANVTLGEATNYVGGIKIKVGRFTNTDNTPQMVRVTVHYQGNYIPDGTQTQKLRIQYHDMTTPNDYVDVDNPLGTVTPIWTDQTGDSTNFQSTLPINTQTFEVFTDHVTLALVMTDTGLLGNAEAKVWILQVVIEELAKWSRRPGLG